MALVVKKKRPKNQRAFPNQKANYKCYTSLYAGRIEGCNLSVSIFGKTSSMTRVLFVCLGNICRSPLAEAIFNSQIREGKFQTKFIAASCATANYHVGSPPDPRTIRNALLNGIEIKHVGRQFSVVDFEAFDWIIAMDRSNYNNILQLPNSKNYRNKIKLMRVFDTEYPGVDVPDPYYGGEKDFQEVFDILTRSVSGLIKVLEE